MRYLSNTLSTVRDIYSRRKVQSDIKKFIQHNLSVFPKRRTEGNGPVFLMEINAMASAVIAYSYLAAVVSEKYNATVVGFFSSQKQGSYYQKQGEDVLSTVGIYQ